MEAELTAERPAGNDYRGAGMTPLLFETPAPRARAWHWVLPTPSDLATAGDRRALLLAEHSLKLAKREERAELTSQRIEGCPAALFSIDHTEHVLDLQPQLA